MAEVVFFVASLVVIAGAAGTVLLRNAFYAVLALVCHLLGLAALFLLLRAEFVAAAQVIVYAGAVMVLYVFVVAYVGQDDHSLRRGEQRTDPSEPPALGAERLVRAAHVGHHEHVEHHHRAGVDHHLRRCDELGVQKQEQHRQGN